jgi:hypothetical protein
VLLDRACALVLCGNVGEFAVVGWRKGKRVIGGLCVTVICLEGVADAICAGDVVEGYARLGWVGRVGLDLLVANLVDRVGLGKGGVGQAGEG